MSVYIDNMGLPGRGRFRNTKWYHMIAIPFDNPLIHEIAVNIGLKRSWFQTGKTFPHYDVTESKRILAIQAGVIPVSTKKLVAMAREFTNRVPVEVEIGLFKS